MTHSKTPAAVSLRAKMEQAVNEFGEPADAVCQCSADSSWVAWWGQSCDWQAFTDMAYPKGGGFHAPPGFTSVEHTPEGWFWVAEAKAKEGKE